MGNTTVLEKLPADLKHDPNFLYQRKRVYILPTSAGFLYALIMFVMLLGAINYSNSMAFTLCFLLTGLGVISILHTYKNLRGLIVKCQTIEPIFVGDTALCPIVFNNQSDIPRYAIKIEQFYKRHFLRTDQPYPINCLDCKEYGSHEVKYPLNPQQRGLQTCTRFIISSSFPLGLLNSWAYCEADIKFWVYPQPIGSKTLPKTSIVHGDLSDLGGQAGIGDFMGIKEYKPGDRIRSIAWKILAKNKKLYVKQFGGHGDKLILDWQQVSHIQNIEDRLSQLCQWILIADQQSLHYGLKLPHIEINVSHGNKHKHQCLQALASY